MTAVEAQFYWMSAKVPSDQFLLCSNDPPTSPHQHRPQTAIITPEWRSPGTPRSTGIDNFSRSHRPVSCPHQMPATVEAALLELRRSRPYWGPRRLVFELAKRRVTPVPSESAAYRALVRAGMIDPSLRDRRSRKWKRWERGAPMELWQMDIVGGFPLADGTSAKALTGIDDHSRMCVCARLMARERTRAVCDGLRGALTTYGSPEQILTDNGKVFTGRFFHPPVEVLFDAIGREHGIEHLLTAPRSPTTTGKIERFHRAYALNSSATERLSLISRPPSKPSMTGSTTTTTHGRTNPWTWPPLPKNSPPAQSEHPDRRRAPRARIAPATTGSAAG
jgi:transposase InsO family protein